MMKISALLFVVLNVDNSVKVKHNICIYAGPPVVEATPEMNPYHERIPSEFSQFYNVNHSIKYIILYFHCKLKLPA